MMKQLSIIFCLIVLAVSASCSSKSSDNEPSPTAPTENSIFNKLKGTSWVANMGLCLMEVYFSPNGNGVIYSRTSVFTGFKSTLEGKRLNDNTAMYAQLYSTNEGGGPDAQMAFALESSDKLIGDLIDNRTGEHLEIPLYRLKKSIECKIGEELTADKLGIVGHFQAQALPYILFNYQDYRAYTTGEGLGFVFVTQDENTYAIKLVIKPIFGKKTDILLYPYENCLGMTLDDVDDTFFELHQQKLDDSLFFLKDANDDGYIQGFAFFADEDGIVDGIKVYLNQKANFDELYTMLESLHPSSFNFIDGDTSNFFFKNFYGDPCAISLNRIESALYYVNSVPGGSNTIDKVDFGKDIILN